MQQPNLIINGGKPLKGTVRAGGSKNAALPIIAATLLSKQPTTLTNVPDIADVHTFLELLAGLGVKSKFETGRLTIDPIGLSNNNLNPSLVSKMRASILFAGPLFARFGQFSMPFPGGCVLGKRSISSHVLGFKRLGAESIDTESNFSMRRSPNKELERIVILPEFSVTATENILMAASLTETTTEIRVAAIEPHVQDLCHFLVAMGVQIEGIGTHTLKVTGKAELDGVSDYKIISDYLQAGTFLLAGVVTNGEVTVTDFNPTELDIFFEKLEEIGVNFTRNDRSATVYPSLEKMQAIESLKTGIHPNFPTDLQAPFVVALTQAQGVSKIFETMFEGRFQYLFELEKMGAKVELLNPHQALVIGGKKLKGATVSSCDIRAGAAVVLAALAAEGETIITNVQYIRRGYEFLEEKLKSLGANIEQEEEA